MTSFLITVRPQHAPGDAQLPAATLFLLGGNLDAPALAQLMPLLYDPVVQTAEARSLAEVPAVGAHSALRYLEIAFRPGVTDNEAESLLIGARRIGVHGLQVVRTLQRYVLPPGTDAALWSREHYNPLIQTTLVYFAAMPETAYAWYAGLLAVPAETSDRIAQVPLREADDQTLLRISREGILALDLVEMRTLRDYFVAEGRDPTDGELETIAQTWSEHCSHKSFKARVRYRVQGLIDEDLPAPEPAELYRGYTLLRNDCEIDSLFRSFIMAATRETLGTLPLPEQAEAARSWVLSTFVDNAGIIAFGEHWEVACKVETHNHPSALEPFGGANTGVGGVIRDVLGVSSQPIANTDVLCFGDLDLPASELAEGVLHPRRVFDGVVAGVRDYGNKLGIPTVNGAILFDRGYTANPLVFCGTVGIAPRGKNPRRLQPGDAVVVLGGRTGRDGIHGATFSSEELTHQTAELVGSAVQIGDPITEKKMLDVLLAARDAGLYSAITDCGAGGLSSAVGEMGAETGVEVALEDVPLKYAGLQPWEIWLSEAQERMVLAVPPQHLQAFLALCAAEDVEATPIGRFTDSRRLRVTCRGATLVDLDLTFLHDGRPQRLLEALWDVEHALQQWPQIELSAHPVQLADALLALLSHRTIASKEQVIRSYDHEVGGATVLKPLVGVAEDGPGDAAVLWPRREIWQGLALGCGINPRYGRIDPYWMALACVDEALRNVVAVGGDPAQTAILDNFCWGDPRQPDRMAGLVRAAAGCYDAAVALGTPFISGKDSLNNEYRLPSGERVPIPGTLLITALALHPDVRRAVSMDFKQPGNVVYLLGLTRAELGGAHIWDCKLPMSSGEPEDASRQPALRNPYFAVPRVDLALARRSFRALHSAIQQGLVRACHDLSEGGLAVAAAESCIAGRCGLNMDLRAVPADQTACSDGLLLFSESSSRFLIEVEPANCAALEATLAGLPLGRLGTLSEQPWLRINGLHGTEVIALEVEALRAAWQRDLTHEAKRGTP